MHSKLLSQMVMVLMASSGVLAHMEMLKPFPILSKNDPKNAGKQDIDYSMTRPLASEGGVSDYPCFGYTTKEAHSVETYAAGQTYQLQYVPSRLPPTHPIIADQKTESAVPLPTTVALASCRSPTTTAQASRSSSP